MLFWPVLLAVLGLVFGSFIATVALRLPQGRSALSGRSMCDACGTQLRATELVPLFSFLFQRGRCRHCGARIAPDHGVIEILGCAIGIAAGLAAPGWEGALGAAFGWQLLALGAIDRVAYWLPDPLTAALALTGLAAGWLVDVPGMGDRLLGGALGFGVLAAVRYGYRALRGREGLGGGDPKLFGAIGLWLGWRALAPVMLVAALGGLALVLALRLGGRRMGMADRMPLGSLLAPAAFLVWWIQAYGPAGPAFY